MASAESGAKIIKSLLPSLTKIMDAAAGAAEKFSKMPQPVQNAVIHIGLFTAALGPAASGAGKMLKNVSSLTGVLKRFGAKKAAKEAARLGSAASEAAPALGSMASAAGKAAPAITGVGKAAGKAAAVGAAGTSAFAGIGTSLAAIAPVALPVAGGIAAVAVAVKSYKDQQAEANKATDNAVQKADTLGRSVDALSSKVSAIKTNYQDNIAKVQANAEVARNLNDRLQNLVKTQGDTKG